MLVKIHPRGVSGEDAIRYLLSMKDSNGQERKTEPEVLRGNPDFTEDLIETSPHKNRYTSGVLSFEEHPSKISQAQQEEIMDLFEETALAGFERDQVNILWVRHTDKDRLELNFLIPNQELDKGRFVNFYYDKADRPRFNAFQEYTNASYGFSSPHDPERTRPVLLSKDFRRGNKREIIEGVTQLVSQGIAAGLIENRDDVIRDLQKAGFTVTRVGKDYLTIYNPTEPDRRGVRLKGAFYGESFTSVQGLAEEHRRSVSEYQQDAGQRAEHFKSEREREIQARDAFIRKRYYRDGQSLSFGIGPEPTQSQREHDPQGEMVLPGRDSAVHDRDYADVLIRELDGEAHHPDANGNRELGSRSRGVGIPHGNLRGERIHSDRSGEPGHPGEAGKNLGGWGESQAHRDVRLYLQTAEEGAINDRSRTALSQSLRSLDRTLRSDGTPYDGVAQRFFRTVASLGTTMERFIEARRASFQRVRETFQSWESGLRAWNQSVEGARSATLRVIHAAQRFTKTLEAQQREIEQQEREAARNRGMDWTM